MRVLVAYQYFSFKGGIEQVLAAQSSGLHKRGNEVRVLTSSYLDDQPAEIEPGIPIRRVRALNYLYQQRGIPFAIPVPTPANIKAINDEVRWADVVNVHGHPYLFSLVVMIFAAIHRKPVAITQHNTKIETKSPILSGLYWTLEHTIGRRNLRRASLIIAVSEQTGEYVREVARTTDLNVIRIYNGVDAERFHPTKDKLELRAQLHIPAEAFVCFTVRRITFKNGIDTLLDTAAVVIGDQNIVFLLGGTGADIEAVRHEIADRALSNIEVLGPIADEDLPRYYAASDAFVLPSRPGEGFPMVVLEALASGLPVVATRSGGHVEIIKDGETGYLVDPDRPRDLARRIDQLSNEDAQEISTRCRSLVVEGFTWESNVEQLCEALYGIGGSQYDEA